jgi:hypothetical protein
MRTLKNTNKRQHGESVALRAPSQNVRKQRGLAPGRLVFAGFRLVGTPGFEPDQGRGVRRTPPHKSLSLRPTASPRCGQLRRSAARRRAPHWAPVRRGSLRFRGHPHELRRRGRLAPSPLDLPGLRGGRSRLGFDLASHNGLLVSAPEQFERGRDSLALLGPRQGLDLDGLSLQAVIFS